MEAIKWVMEHGFELLGLVSLALSLAIGIAMLIPGEQPEKALQKVLDVIKGFSKK